MITIKNLKAITNIKKLKTFKVTLLQFPQVYVYNSEIILMITIVKHNIFSIETLLLSESRKTVLDKQ